MSEQLAAGRESRAVIAQRIAARKPTRALVRRLADHAGIEVEVPWQDRGLCRQTDPELFFPTRGGGSAAARRLCGGCEVKDECLEYALTHDEDFGIWGGTSGPERRRLKDVAGHR